MKYIKIFAVILGVVGLSACNEKDELTWNSASGVTVSMADTELSFKESRGLVSIPFVVNGDPDGYMTVSCEVREYPNGPAGSDVAIDDMHYFVTTKTINIDPEEKEGHFEVWLVDDYEENDDRMFTVKLIDPEHCQLAGTTETIVTLKDNDKDPYERLEGQWYLHSTDYDGEANPLIKVKIIAAEEGQLAYYNTYSVYGIFENPNDEYTAQTIMAEFQYDETTKEGAIVFPYGQKLEDYEYGQYGLGTGLFAHGSSISGSCSYTWNDKVSALNAIAYPEMSDGNWSGAIFSYILKFGVGTLTYDSFYNVYFTRQPND